MNLIHVRVPAHWTFQCSGHSPLDWMNWCARVCDSIHPDTVFSGFKFTVPLLCPMALMASCLPQQKVHRSPHVLSSPSHGPALCPTHLLPSNYSLLLPVSGLPAALQPHHLHPTSSPFSLLFALGSLHNCSSNVSAILWFIIKNICLVFVLIPWTNFLKPLEFPKWWVIKERKESEVAQSCPTLCDPLDCSPPGSSIHGILQARVLEWIAVSCSRGSSWPRDQTQVSCIAGRHFTIWATREAPKGIKLSCYY